MPHIMQLVRITHLMTAYILAYGEMPILAAEIEAPVCMSEVHHGFDFWIGDWVVFARGSSQPIADSAINASHDGCIILENYRTRTGHYSGMSMNFYDSRIGYWRQTWVDNSGSAIFFTGNLTPDGSMLMADTTDPKLLKRVSWKKMSDGSVHQLGERSLDGGKSWYIAFDGIYRKNGER